MGPLDHGADHNAGAALLAVHLHHGGVTNGKLRRFAQNCCKGLGISASGTDFQLQSMFFKNTGVLADV